VPAWDFNDEVLRWLHGKQSLSDPEDLLPRKCPPIQRVVAA